MFDKVAMRYDITNDVLSLGQTRGWRSATVAAVDPRPGQRVLDLAAGIKPKPAGNASAAHAPHNVYRCAGPDAWIGLAVTDDNAWRALCALAPDLRVLENLTLAGRAAHGAEIDALDVDHVSTPAQYMLRERPEVAR